MTNFCQLASCGRFNESIKEIHFADCHHVCETHLCARILSSFFFFLFCISCPTHQNKMGNFYMNTRAAAVAIRANRTQRINENLIFLASITSVFL